MDKVFIFTGFGGFGKAGESAVSTKIITPGGSNRGTEMVRRSVGCQIWQAHCESSRQSILQ
jgi:hypothetical protein